MSRGDRDLRHGAGLALLSAALFGAATPASKWLLAGLRPFQLAGLLYLGAALAMAPAHYAEQRGEPSAPLDPANRRRLVGAVVAGGILGPVLLLFGLERALAGSVALMLNLEVAATAALGVAFFGEHLGRRGWLAVAGVFVAGVVVSWSGGWPGLGAGGLVALACVCWGLDNHWTALIDGMSPARATLWKGLVAGSVNLAIGLAAAPLAASGGTVAAALAVGGLSYGASIVLYIRSAHQMGAIRAQALFASAPFIGAGLSFAWLGEPAGWTDAVGGALLALSVGLLLRSRHEHVHVHEAIEHVHSHRHDDGHHVHAHPDAAGEEAVPARHSHWHRHEPIVHSHPHWPDLHHRHLHRPAGSGQEPEPQERLWDRNHRDPRAPRGAR